MSAEIQIPTINTSHQASKWLSSLTPKKRYSKAKDRLIHIKPILKDLIIHESNHQRVAYSTNHALNILNLPEAISFSALQLSLVSYSVVRITALWDKAKEDRASIPTILALILHEPTLELIQADRGFADIAETVAKVSAIHADYKMTADSSSLERFVAYRDRFVAHNLIDLPQKGSPIYGEETILMRETVNTIAALEEFILGTTNMEEYQLTHNEAFTASETLWKGV